MERLQVQGRINPSYLGEQLDVECLEQEFANRENLKFEEEEAQFSTESLEEKIPFLQMLQSVESSPILAFPESNFQALLRLQNLKKPWDSTYPAYMPSMETQIQALELESCVTHDIVELYSPVKSEKLDLHRPQSTELAENCEREGMSGSSPVWANPETRPKQSTHRISKSPPTTRERKKRKRTKPAKNKEEVESQRMTHIAVERNRRRQMNDHLNALRSLMPTSYIQRGDQASIIGGAIDFVKELEQLLEYLEAQKRMRKTQEGGDTSSAGGANVSCAAPPPQFGSASEDGSCCGEEFTAEKKSEVAEIEVTAIQSHVNLKIHCQRRPGQLLKAILAFEDLGFTVLHLNITSSQSSVLYSFNLKIEDECNLGLADEIAGAVHEIFSMINGSGLVNA